MLEKPAKQISEEPGAAKPAKSARKNPKNLSKHDIFKKGTYPYSERMSRAEYEQKKAQLQIELLKMQNWVKETGQRLLFLFEGRDAAGKGGTIKRFMEHLNLRMPNGDNGTSNAISNICQPPVKSSCLTALGTTVPAWSA